MPPNSAPKPTARYRPQLTDAARPSTFDVPTRDEHGATGVAAVAGEHPLTVYVDKREILTLMTLG
ncbi:MAG TPA: sulfurtransferase FdhD, partial [Casimicrobium sp.]|nr:sulfurtransferase FdhD [Casimicrobium sp.]